MSLIQKIYYISVKFYGYEGWSKGYTYLHYEPLKKGTAVIVPKKNWYSLGRVYCTHEEYIPSPDIEYLKIYKVLDL